MAWRHPCAPFTRRAGHVVDIMSAFGQAWNLASRVLWGIAKYTRDDAEVMKKTLVLVVDRDDDFGYKGGVESPVIGVEACSVAATALGIADPEDSDINALYAAINIYKDLCNDRNQTVEVALICGDQKVGYRSDSAIVEELELVIERVRPDRIILVGDGAEDEYVYPIISSRVRIDSVRKVYVKQAPGIEGTLYIISKILEDAGKRKRFLAPIGWILVIIALIYLLPAIMQFNMELFNIASVTTPGVVFVVGVFLVFYAYNVQDRMSAWKTRWLNRFKSGSITVTFTLLSLIIAISGIVYGLFAFDYVYIISFFQAIVWYCYNVLWFIIFSVMVYYLGEIFDTYLNSKAFVVSRMTFCNSLLATGLLIMGALDMMLIYFGTLPVGTFMPMVEIGFGILLAFITMLIQRHLRLKLVSVEEETDAVL